MALDPTTRPRFAKLTLRTDCARCGANLPVNGPSDTAECAECGHEHPLNAGLFRWALEAFDEEFPHPVRTTKVDGDLTWRLTADGFAAPPCSSCPASISVVGEDGAVCEGCGAAATQVKAPKEWGDRASRVFVPMGAGGHTDAAPVALNCPSCGAGLSVGRDAPRLTKCEHCGSQVHLPELVWRRFHPKRATVPWVARIDREAPAAKAARQEAKREDDLRDIARKQREKDSRRQEQQEKDRARQHEKDARTQAEKAVAAAEKAEKDKRWALLTSPLVLISALLAISAVGAMALGLTVDVWHAATPKWRSWRQYGLAADVFPTLVTVYALGVWAACVVMAVIRGRTGFAGVFWSGLMMLFAHIPLVGVFLGWFWAWEHVRDREPTMELEGRLPFLTGVPLALVYATLPAYDTLMFVFVIE